MPPLWGLRQTLRAHPALKRWAKLFRPYGTCAGPLQRLSSALATNSELFTNSRYQDESSGRKPRIAALHQESQSR